MSDRFSPLPEPPYFAVIFSSQVSNDTNGYDPMAKAMVELAQTQQGFLGIEATRDASGFGITVSYWQDEESIAAWKANARHAIAQKNGMARWYDHYQLRVARVERGYSRPDGR